MSTFKKIIAWSLVVISIIGILVCTAGLVGTWVMKDRLTTRILSLLSTVQAGVTRVEDSLTTAKTQIADANLSVKTIHEAAANLGDRVEENTPVIDRITKEFNDNLYPRIQKVQNLIQLIRERALAVNNTIEALNTFPGINLPTLTPQMEALDARVQNVMDTVEQLRANIADFKTGVVQNVLEPFLAKLDTAANFLTQLETDITTYVDQLNRIQAAAANLQAKIPSMITIISILISILLITSILGQISLILLSRLYLKTGQMIWNLKSPEQSAAEVLPLGS